MIELIEKVQAWAKEKGIYDKSTPDKQWLGIIAEIGEVSDWLFKENYEEAEMELGDVIVYYINYMFMKDNVIKVSDFAQMYFGEYSDRDVINNLLSSARMIDVIHRRDFELTVAIVAGHIGTTPERALSRAYEKISKRSGQMKNGKFSKDG